MSCHDHGLSGDYWADLLGVPYRSGGRDRTGLDCLGLVLVVQRRLGYDPPDPVAGYDALAPGRLFIDWAASGWDRAGAPEPGDAILCTVGEARFPNHVAVFLGCRKALQVFRGGVGVAVADIGAIGRIEGFYRPRGTARQGHGLAIAPGGDGWVRVRARRNWLDSTASEEAWMERPRTGVSVLDLRPAQFAGVPDDHLVIILSGRRLTPAQAALVEPQGGDEIFFSSTPGIPVAAMASLLAVAETSFIAIAAATVANIIVGAALSYLASLIATPDPGTPDAGDEASPTYAIDGAYNRAQNGASIPIVYGETRVGGQILQVFTRANAQFKSTLYMLIGLGEGPVESVAGITENTDNIDASAIAGTAIEVNGNAAAGFRNVTYHVRLGTTDQNAIPGFEETVNSFAVGVTLRRATTFSVPSSCQVVAENDETYSYSTDAEVDAFEINVRFPVGIYKIDGDGNTQSYSCCLTLSYERTGIASSKVTEFVYFGPSTLRADHTRTIRRTVSVRDKYTIYLTRVTSNDDETERRFSTSEITSINEILTTAALAYPNQALLAVEALGTEQLSGGIPTVTAMVKGRKAWIWDGVSETSPAFTQAWTDNPAWIALDILLTKDIGLGAYVTLNQIDLQSFKDWADYCDESVTTDGTSHDRWDYNGVFDVSMPAWEAVQRVAACGRASVTLSGAKFRAKVDKAATPSQLFSMGNIVPNTLRVTYLDVTARPNHIEVEYQNANLNYERDVAQLSTDADPVKKSLVQFIGMTKPQQAYRAAKYMLNVANAVDKKIEFVAPIDAVTVDVMDTIYFQHDIYSGTYGGRVKETVSGPTRGITLDQDITVPASPAWALVVRSYDSSTGAETFAAVTPAAGTYASGDTITTTPDWSSTALPQKGDVYAIGPATSYLKQWRILRRTLTPEMNVKLEGIEYDSSVYSDDPGEIEEFTDTYPSPRGIPDTPTGLRVTEIARRQKDGSVRHTLDVSFARPSGTYAAAEHDIWTRRVTDTNASLEGDEPEPGGGVYDWIYRGSTFTDRAEIESDSYRAIVEVAVVPRGPGGVRRDPRDGAIARIVCLGRIAMPAAPTNLAAYQVGDKTLLTWDAPTDCDIDHYEVRMLPFAETNPAWFHAQEALVIAQGNDYALIQPFGHGTSMLVLVKSVNTSGVPCILPATLTYTPDEPPYRARTHATESLTWPGAQTDCTVVSNKLRTDEGVAESSYVSTNLALNRGACLLQVVTDLIALELTTTGAEAGYPANSEHAQRLLGDGTLLDYPDPEREYTGESANFPATSPMALTIRPDNAQDWAQLHKVRIEYDLAQDAGATTWDGWKTYRFPVTVYNRYYVRVRLTFTNAAEGRYQTELRYLGIISTAHQVMEHSSVTMTGTSAKTYNYVNTYGDAPFVIAEPADTNSGWKVLQTSKTRTSVALQVVDANGEPVSGATINVLVIEVG